MIKRKVTHAPECYPWVKWPAGRLLLAPVSQKPAYETGSMSECIRKVADDLGPNDILAVRLYDDVLETARKSMDRLPDYDESIALIRDIGPHIGGVMVGNQLGLELSYRHFYNSWRGDAIGNISDISEFIRRVGGMLRDMGVTPWFAAMDWDALQDAYHAHRMMLAALTEVGAVNWIACGYTMVPGAYVKKDKALEGHQIGAQLRWSRRNKPDDLPVIREYLQAGNFWSGLCGIDGIRGGNIELLESYGFKGFATRIEPCEEEDLIIERGDEWWDKTNA
jgi:hypothetical protein